MRGRVHLGAAVCGRGQIGVLVGIVALAVFFSAGAALAANPSGGLRIEVVAAHNLVVDSNVGTPSSKSPNCAYLGATFYNDGSNELSSVFAYIGNYINGTNDTPGIYPTNRTSEILGPLPGGMFALTHEGGTAGTGDAIRYLGTLAPGESVTVYWLVSYPLMGTNSVGAPIPTWGSSVKPDDDLTLEYDIWGTAVSITGSNLTATVTRDVTMRNEITSAANKIFPNGANKVPQEYLDLLNQYAPAWTNAAADGSVGTRITVEGYWYDLGNVGDGFDNDGDLVPDRNAWMQPVGDSSLFDPSCFRLVKTHALVVVKLKSGGEQVYNVDDQLYFEHIPENNGAVGLVLYEFLPLKAGCVSMMTPYQEVASGRDNEKFNADYGATLGQPVVSGQANVTLDKTADRISVAPGTNITYTIAYTNASSQKVGDAGLSVPLVIQDSVPTGTVYVAGSATSSNVLPGGVSAYTVLYSTNSGLTWATNEPPAAQVTDIQWWLSDALVGSSGGLVRLTVTVLSSYSNGNPVISNTAGVSLGNTTPFTNSTVRTLVMGTNFLGDYVFADTGSGTNFGNGRMDSGEPGISNVAVRLYYDLNSNRVQDASDVYVGSTNSGLTGYYVFTNLLDGRFVVVVDAEDADIPFGYTSTTSLYYSVSLDPTGAVAGTVSYTNADFGFAPALLLTKTGPSWTREGSNITYTITVTNRLQGNGGLGVVTAWASDGVNGTPAAKAWLAYTNLFIPPGRDGLMATGSVNGIDETVTVSNFFSTAAVGEITKVEIVIPLRTNGLAFGTGTKQDNFDVDLMSNGVVVYAWTTAAEALVNGDLVINVTTTKVWQWADFTTGSVMSIQMRCDGNDSKANGEIYADAVGLRVTTIRTGATDGEEPYILNPVPVTDTYNPALLKYVSAIPVPTSTNVPGTLYWANVGPISPGGAKTISVTYRVPEPLNNATSVVTNAVFVTNATYASGRPANTNYAQQVTTNAPAGSIGDRIWRDVNGNGIEDTNDVGLAGISVVLVPTNGVDAGAGPGVSITNVTDANGYYLFSGLWVATNYNIVVLTNTLPTGGGTFTNVWDRDGTNNSRTVVYINPYSTTGGDTVTNADFGYRFQYSTIVGTIWHDWNRNGTNYPDNGENWLTNVVVRLYTNGVLVATTTTDTNGFFRFTGPYTNGFTVQVYTNSGMMTNTSWVQSFDTDGIAGTSTNNVVGSVSAGGYARADFSYYRVGPLVIGDLVWYDWNGNGVTNAGEESINDITVRLYFDRNTNGVVDLLDPLVLVQSTDTYGTYLFTNLFSTNYIVVVDEADPDFPPLHYNTWDPYGEFDGRSRVALTDTNLLQDFGYQPYGWASIGDTVWRDMNGDGVQSGAGETGITNALVLLKADMNHDGTYVTVFSARTDASGHYLFEDLPAGSYRIEIVADDPAIPRDSFGVPYRLSTTNLYAVTLAADEAFLAADFGLVPPAAIGDTLYWDANANGTLDWSEAGVTGVWVFLYLDANSNRLHDAGEPLVGSNRTDAAGLYIFTDLNPGRYVVAVDTNAAALAGTQITGDPDADGDPAGPGRDGQFGTTLGYGTAYMGADFGFVPGGVIGDRLWLDVDGDGVQDPTEGGIPYVNVELWSNATLLATSETDADGYYMFSGYPDYTGYWVRVATNDTDFPAGLTATYDADGNLDGRASNIVVGAGHITNVNGSVWSGGDLGIDFGYRYAGNNTLIGTVGLETAPATNGVMGTGTNGVEAGEFPYAGVTLYLNLWRDLDGDGVRDQGEVTALGSTLTATNGDYAFLDLPAAIGSSNFYIVSVSAPDTELRLTTTTNSAVPSVAVSNFVNDLGYTVSALQIVPVATSVTNVDFAFVSMAAHDYGDLPDTYSTTMPGGPRHKVKSSPTLYLGARVDTESNGQPGAAASDDDTDQANDDEDGVIPLGAWQTGAQGGAVQVTASTSGWLVAFIDFGTNGVFTDAGDLVLTQAVSAGTSTNVFDIPTNAAISATNVTTFYARFRLFNALPYFAAMAYGGSADEGEVEDYRWSFGVVSDLVWNDLNSNGVQEAGEAGIPNVRVFVDANTNGMWDTGEASGVTDTNGLYSIGGLCAGLFTIAVDTGSLVAGSVPVYDLDGTTTQHRVTTNLTSAQVYTNFDFGYMLPKTDLGVTKTVDSTWVSTNGYASFTIVLTNNGPSKATSIRLQDLWPADIAFSTAWASTGTYDSAECIWSNFSLAVGAGATLVITGHVDSTQIGMPLTNRIRIASLDQYDTNPANDQDDAVVETLVVVARVEAYSDGQAGWVEWETSSEIGTVGFNLYRVKDGKARAQVNETLVPAVIDAPQGGVYRVADPAIRAGGACSYLIEELEHDGTKREYGPFDLIVPQTVSSAAPTGVEGTARQNEVARMPESGVRSMKAALAAPAVAAAPLFEAPVPALAASARPTLKPLKLTVNGAGVYGIEAADIAALFGADPSFVAMVFASGMVRLSNLGRRIPFLASNDGSVLYFYGEAVDSPYTDVNVYWLTWESGAVMKTAKVSGGSAAGETTFVDTIHFEQDRYGATAVVLEPEGDFWLWEYLMAGSSTAGRRSFVLHADGVASTEGSATLVVRLVSSTAVGRGRDHHVVVKLNGTVIGEEAWVGMVSREMTLTFSQGLLRDGDNTVEITSLLEPLVPYSIVYLDSFDLTYLRRHEAVTDRLTFHAGAEGTASVVGFTTPSVRVLDVTDPAVPRVLAGARVRALSGGSFSVVFGGADPAARYSAFTPASALPVTSMAVDAGTDLRAVANEARHVIVTVPSLAAAAERLAAHRRGRGLSSKVVLLEDIYDEFGYGIASPHAIRAFLSYARTAWRVPPGYLVLAGEGSYDYKNIKKTGDCIVPPFMVATPKSLFGTDAPYADPDGDGAEDLAVGRLPAMTAEELNAMVDKIIAYETAPAAAWQSVATLTADVPDKGGDFTRSSDETGASVPGGWVRTRVHLAEMSVQSARAKLVQQINSGTAFLNFHGHGGMDTLSSRGLFKTADVAGLANGGRLPIVTAMSCVIGRFEIPGYDSLGEALLLRSGAGAVAVWAPSGLSYNGASALLGREFYRAVLEQGEGVLGEAIRTARAAALENGCPAECLALYNLLGDPATVTAGFDAVYGDGQAAGMSFNEWKRLDFTWADRQDESTAGDEADPDGDGVPNLAEYVFGRNPMRAESAPLCGLSGEARDPSYDFEVRFSRNRNVSGAGAEIEVSGDLATWIGGSGYIGPTEVSDDGNGLTETVRALVRTPDPERRKGFIRLRAWKR